MTLGEFLAAIGQMLAPIIEPLLEQALYGAFTKFMESTAVVGGRNEDLEKLWRATAGNDDDFERRLRAGHSGAAGNDGGAGAAGQN